MLIIDISSSAGPLMSSPALGDDNSSHCWLVPLCLGVHWDVHLAIVDEAGLAGLPEQRLAFFITSYYQQIKFLTFLTL